MRFDNIRQAVRPIRLGVIILAVTACIPLLAESQTTPTTPIIIPRDGSLSNALAGAVPIIVASGYIPQGKVTATAGDVVKDYVWVVPGAWSVFRSSNQAVAGFKGVFTRIIVNTTTSSRDMISGYTLYKNGQPTMLSCRLDSNSMAWCSFNHDVPINVGDRWNIGVYLPKTAACMSSGVTGCSGATPIITLMVRMVTN
jgi:hypothetical protein